MSVWAEAVFIMHSGLSSATQKWLVAYIGCATHHLNLFAAAP